jgi:hypothetical protein
MIQNSTKIYIKQFKIYKTDPQKSLTVLGNILEQHEQWRRVFPRAAANPRAAAKATGKQGSQGRLLLLCLPTPAVGSPSPATTKKNTQMAVGFNFSFLYRSASLSLFFVSDLLLSTDRFFSFAFSFFSISGGSGVGGVAAVVQALMVFAPLGISGGGRGRSAGGWSVQRRAGG